MAGNSAGPNRPALIVLIVLVILVIILLAFVVYEYGELSSIQNSYDNLQAEDSNLSGQIAGIEGQLFTIQNQLNSLTTTTTNSVRGLSVNITGACLSITPSCNGTLAYAIMLYNNGGVTIPANYSIYLSFKGGTKDGIFGFNTIMPNFAVCPRGVHQRRG